MLLKRFLAYFPGKLFVKIVVCRFLNKIFGNKKYIYVIIIIFIIKFSSNLHEVFVQTKRRRSKICTRETNDKYFPARIVQIRLSRS